MTDSFFALAALAGWTGVFIISPLSIIQSVQLYHERVENERLRKLLPKYTT